MIIIIVLCSRSRSPATSMLAYFPQHNNLLHSSDCHCLSSIAINARIRQSNTCSSAAESSSGVCVCGVWATRSRQFLFVYCSAAGSLLDDGCLFSASDSWRARSTPPIGTARTTPSPRTQKRAHEIFVPDSAWHIYVYFNCIHRRNCNNKGKHYPNEYLFGNARCDPRRCCHPIHTGTQSLIQSKEIIYLREFIYGTRIRM